MPLDLVTAVEAAKLSGVLHLSNMGLMSVPSLVFDALPNLVRLDLSSNELVALPPEVGKLRNLEQLWLNDNPLESLPDEIESCTALRVVDLRDTLLTHLPVALGRLPAIIELALSNTRLEPAMQAAYASGGTLKLLSYLNEAEVRQDLEKALRETLTVDVYRESADTEAGKGRVEELVAECMAEFRDNNELRTVIRNAGRLFNESMGLACAGEVRARHTDLLRDNIRKALAADVELKLRAIYYGSIDPVAVPKMVSDIMACMTTLEDTAFLLEHSKRLFPSDWRQVKGRDLHSALVAMRAMLAAERARAIDALVSALGTIYPDREPKHIDALARSVCSHLKNSDDIRNLASEATELFPPEFASAKPKKIFQAFVQSKKEKGL
jgi:hypothetical protein